MLRLLGQILVELSAIAILELAGWMGVIAEA